MQITFSDFIIFSLVRMPGVNTSGIFLNWSFLNCFIIFDPRKNKTNTSPFTMIKIPLSKTVIDSFEIASKNPVLCEICSDFLFTYDSLLIPEERFKDPSVLDKFLLTGLADRVQ